MRKNDDIVNYEVMGGWPMFKMNIREIVEKIGFKLSDGKWQLEDSNPILDVYPRKLNDDGMGYGVNEENVVEVGVFENDGTLYCNLFTEGTLDKIDLWKKGRFFPHASVMRQLTDDKEFYVIDIKEENEEIQYLCENAENAEEKIWLKETDLEYY